MFVHEPSKVEISPVDITFGARFLYLHLVFSAVFDHYPIFLSCILVFSALNLPVLDKTFGIDFAYD